MSSYYDDDEELDIRIHRGRVSPGPVVYPEVRYRTAPRPVYYQHGSSYLVPEVTTGNHHRSRSTGHRTSPPPAPVIINNRIYNDYDEDGEDDRYRQLARLARPRSRSRSRAPSFSSSRDEYELEKTRRELEAYKLDAEREKEEKRIKKEMELHRMREEKRAEEEKKRLKKEAEEAVEKFKINEAERIAKQKKEEEETIAKFKAKEEKEKKEKEEKEKEYQHRLEDDLRKAGMDERQIAVLTNKEKAVDPNRPTYTRMSRRHLSIETLNRFRIDYEFDVDPDYLLIKRWVPEYEQDFLWNHTREIRERRQPVLIAIEGKKKHHHEPEFEFVRKKEHKRKTSPSPLLTFLAGGKR